MAKMTIHKYRLERGRDRTEIPMHKGAKLLSVQNQDDQITLWALVDTERKLEVQEFSVYGTGWELPPNPGIHVGTVQIEAFVWHVFWNQ